MENLLEKLDSMGADTASGVKRLMGKPAMYIKFLKKFAEATHKDEVLKALADKDYEELVSQTHTLKGTTGNLSLTPLYERYAVIVDDLRAGNHDGLEAKVNEVIALQDAFCEAIEQEN